MTSILNKEQIKALKESGKILHDALLATKKAVKPGVSTFSLDTVAENYIVSHGGTPPFKNYDGYPAALCVSVNDEVVHGIPSKSHILQEGDIVSLDLGVRYKGMCTDSTITVPVGEISKEKQNLIDVTKESLELGIKEAIVGNRIGAIGHAVQEYAESFGFGVVRDLIGHGVGVKPHMDPGIPNYGRITDGPKIVEGMCLAIEPMITLGTWKVYVMPDEWTIKTADGKAAAHFEHTVVIENGQPQIVT